MTQPTNSEKISQKDCLYCGKAILKPKTLSRANWEAKKYCSMRCQWDNRGHSKDIKYCAKHRRLIRWYGNAPLCVFCGNDEQNRRYEWANVTGEYTDDIQDYLPLCVPCHRSFDYSDKQRDLLAQRMKKDRIAIRYKVAQYKNGKLVKIFACASDAARAIGILPVSLREHINKRPNGSCQGYQFRKYNG